MWENASQGIATVTQQNDNFWGLIAGIVLHDVQVAIIEAMRWLNQPLSAVLVMKMFDEENYMPVGHISYHFKRLAELSILEYVKGVPRRGARERMYFLAAPVGGRESNAC